MNQKISGTKVLAIVAFVLVSGVLKATVKSKFRTVAELHSVNSMLQEVASELNERVPFMVNDETQIDRVAAGDRRIMYHYTLVEFPGEIDYGAEVEEIVISALESEMTSKLVSAVCTEMKPVVELGTSVAYHYSDTTGKPLFSVLVEPSDC
jgi:hypothetical protein